MSDTFDEQSRWLDQLRTGDKQALDRLLASCRPYVGVVVRSVTRCYGPAPRQDDSDLIQETMLQASIGVQKFRGSTLAEWLGWLRQIAVRTSHRVLKGHGQDTRFQETDERNSEMRSGDILQDEEPEAILIRRETTTRMAMALGRLPSDMQQVLLARIVDERDYADIAAQFGRTSGATRMLYLRALRRLRQVWTTEFSSGAGGLK